MGTLLSIIGLVVVVKFCIRHRRLVMDKDAFFKAVVSLRKGIVCGWGNKYQHKELDKIIQIVTGDIDMKNNADEDLANSVVAFIKKIKQQQENEKLATQAKGILEKIKAEIAED